MAKKLLSVLLFSLLLFPLLLLPAVARAFDPGCPSIDYANSYLRATDITATSVTLTAQFCVTVQEVPGELTGAGNPGSPGAGVFEYGTKPGENTQKIPVTITPKSTEGHSAGTGIPFIQACYTDSIHPTDLIPCTDYFATFTYQFVPPGQGCPVLTYYKQITFTTQGCFAGTIRGGSPATNSTPSVLPSGPVQMSNVIVQSAAVGSPTVSPGQAVDITASVVNKGSVNGDARVTLYVNGEVVESRGVTVASGQASPVHFQVSRSEPGTYSVYVNGVSAGNFTVDLFTNNDILIYGLIALVTLGIAGTLYMVAKKRSA